MKVVKPSMHAITFIQLIILAAMKVKASLTASMIVKLKNMRLSLSQSMKTIIFYGKSFFHKILSSQTQGAAYLQEQLICWCLQLYIIKKTIKKLFNNPNYEKSG